MRKLLRNIKHLPFGVFGRAGNPVVYLPSRCTRVIDCSRKAEKLFRDIWNKDLLTVQEEVYAIFVNDQNIVVKYMLIHRGGADRCSVDMHTLFKFAYKYNATGIFLAHNHPKGSLKPSAADLEITEEIKDIADRLGFRFLDHIILTDKKYYSFHESAVTL